jgi:magnesium transporter
LTRVTQSEQHARLSVDEDEVLAVASDTLTVEGPAIEGAGERREARIVAWLFQPDRAPREVRIEEVPALITVEANMVWIDLSDYRESEFRALAELTAVPDPVTRSVLSSWQRPHIQLSEGSFSVGVTVADTDLSGRRAVARQLDLVVSDNCLITAHKQPLPFYASLLTRASTDPDLVRLDSGFMLYIVLDELFEDYERLEERMRGEIEGMQARALRDSSEEFLEHILQFKRYTFALTQLAQQHEQLFQGFLRPDFPFLSAPELTGHFRDLQQRLLRLIYRLEQARQEAANTFDIYISHQSHRTNNVMKILTMVATILFTSTFIEGIFSPSFNRLPTHTFGGFFVMLALIGVTTGLELYTFHRSGWM